MTDLEHKALSAWDHIRQCGATFVEPNDGLRAGYRELKRQGKVVLEGGGTRGRWLVRLAPTYRRAFLAGEEVL